MPANPAPVSRQLAAIRYRLVAGSVPEDVDRSDDALIGVELNAWRVVLARLASVHNSGGRVQGWGTVEPPGRPPVAVTEVLDSPPPPDPSDIEIPSDEEPPSSSRSSRTRSR